MEPLRTPKVEGGAAREAARLASPRSRHRSVDGDWVLRLSHACGSELIDRFKGHEQASWIRQLPDRYRVTFAIP